MRWERVAAVLVIALGCVAATEVAPSKAELAALYQKAEKELGAGHYASALKELDAIDTRQPGLAAVQNFRAVILLRQGEYHRAETALQKALAINPDLWSARFNLADVPFLQKNWTEAGSRFAALREAVPRELAEAIVPLVDYKILLTVLFQNDDEKVGALLSKLKSAENSPAFDYAEAAIAFHRGKRGEGKDWMAAAEKDFPAHENQLFRESFYEVGWLPRPTGEPPSLAKFTGTGETAASALANLEQAKRAFEAHDLQNALKFLDAAQEGDPTEAAAIRLRGRILLEEGKFDEAEAALNQAAGADQAEWETKYIRAKISLGRKDYADAGARLQALLAGKSGILKPETAQLLRYQLFLALLREGKDSAAQQTMDQFKFTDQTPALYYAQAAWNFQHDNPKQARQWVDSAKKLFSEEANSEFARTLLDLGSLGKATPSEIAASSPSPSVPSSPANSPPPQVAATEKNKATPAPKEIASAHEASPAPSSTPKAVAKNEGKKQNRTHTEKHSRPEKKTGKVAKTKARRAASAAASPTRSAPPVPVSTPAPTPRPPFLNRLARTLLHTFERPSPKPSGNHSDSPARTEPAKPTTTPSGRR